MDQVAIPRELGSEPDADPSAAGRDSTSARIDRKRWTVELRRVRGDTERLAAPLSPEDQTIQSMADASPTKWHRAHTTWFFEQFLLEPHVPGYRVFDERFSFLFNSYYVAAGPRHARPKRGLVTRPTASEVSAYRAHVDAALEAVIGNAAEATLRELLPIIEIGLHHEQQHQELILTDILHAFAQNPTLPAYDPAWTPPRVEAAPGWVEVEGGVREVGHEGPGFAYDNEGPRHATLIQPVRIARGLVTNADWLGFVEDGGYSRPELWLSDGWATLQAEGWEAPGYWQRSEDGWSAMTLAGLRPVDPALPVCHVSFYEADAFARWAGRDLPTEFEWEVAARQGGLEAAFGNVWQWTRSAYAPYPGYRPAGGALGEYNGKFMANQMVLRGSSVATPAGHARLTYRNFFYPPQRWQFTGVRLSEYRG